MAVITRRHQRDLTVLRTIAHHCRTMDCFTLVGLCALIYFLFYVVVLCFSDCDLRLAYVNIFGKKLDKLKGKVIWITGASSGIGEAMANIIAENQGKMVLSAMRIEKLQAVKDACLSRNKKLKDSDILILELDVTKLDMIEPCFQRVLDHFGTLDILITNVGRSQRAVWENIETEVDRQIFDLNVFGVIALSRLVVTYFNKKRKGRLAVMSSIAGLIGVAYSASFTGTKHAIHGYYESLRIEKLWDNIQITLLCPGPTDCDNLRKSFTEKPNKKWDKLKRYSKKRMSAERCAELCLKSIVNKLDEAWMAQFPILPLVYGIKYYPNITKVVMKYLGNISKNP